MAGVGPTAIDVAEVHDWDQADAAVEESHELVIVDAATPDYESLVNDLVSQRGDGRTYEVVLLDPPANERQNVLTGQVAPAQVDPPQPQLPGVKLLLKKGYFFRILVFRCF